MAGTETGGRGHADLLLQSCVRGVDRDIRGSVAIHLVFFLGRRAMSVAVSLRWKFLQWGHYVGTENDHCGQERGAWRRIGRAQSAMGSGSRGQAVGWEGHGADRVAGSGLGSSTRALGGQRGGRPWPRSGSAGVWIESWNGRSREQARAGGSGVKGSRAGRCHQTPSLVCGRDGARRLAAGRSGQRRDPVAEVSEKVIRGCLKEEGQRSLQLYTKVTPNDGRRLHGDKPGSRVLGPPVSEVTVARRR